ncbi:MAG: hypothetical protein NVS3B14_11080 [Ktedonobacteraceae bacterium]
MVYASFVSTLLSQSLKRPELHPGLRLIVALIHGRQEAPIMALIIRRRFLNVLKRT